MDLDLSDDQLALEEAVGQLLEKEAPVAAVRTAEPLGFDVNLWHKVTRMGLTTVTLPEDRGGGGSGFVDLALAVEQVGRAVAPVPLIEAAVANHLLASVAETPEVSSLLAQAVAGELLATLTLRPAVANVATLVPAGAVADAVIALDGDELVVVRPPGASPTNPAPSVPNLGSLPLADCRLDEGDRVVIARGPRAVEAHRTAVAHWELLTGVALVGLGARALEIGIEYVMMRRAFGVLIASFQTIQHRLADDATALDGARLLAYEAAWAQDAGEPNADTLATMAFLFAGETAFKTTADCLQFHGGYGYTLEYDIQLYFRRAKAWVLVAGDPKTRFAELAHRLYPKRGS